MEREIALVQLKELIGRDLFSCAAEYGYYMERKFSREAKTE